MARSEADTEPYCTFEALTTSEGRLIYAEYWLKRRVIAQGGKPRYVPRSEIKKACRGLVARWLLFVREYS